jgi:hypothetical protein
MTLTHGEREFIKQGSDETKKERRKAIAEAGPLFNDARQNTLERMLTEDCRLEKPYVSKVMASFAEAGGNDEFDLAGLKQAIAGTLDPYVRNKTFLAREVNEIATVVESARAERDKKIVAAGGPARPAYMTIM